MVPPYVQLTEPRATAPTDPLARYCKEEGLDVFQLLSARNAGVPPVANPHRRFLFGLFKGPGR